MVIGSILLFIISFTVFALCTSHQSVAEYGDSAEMITAAFTRGVPHPPSYPLYMFLGYYITHLPFLTPAYLLNLFSGILHAAALVCVFLIGINILEQYIPTNEEKKEYHTLIITLASFCAALALGFSFYFFLYAGIAEVFPLNDFFTALVILLALQFKKHYLSLPYFYVLCIAVGLMLSNQQTSILLIPPILIFLFTTFFRNEEHRNIKTFLILSSTGLLVSIAAFFLPYAYLPIMAKSGSLLDWGMPTTFSQVMATIMRQSYGGTSVSVASYTSIIDPGAIFHYFGILFDSFSYVIFIALIGLIFIIQAIRKHKKEMNNHWYSFLAAYDIPIFLILSIFLSGIFLATYAGYNWSGTPDAGYYSGIGVFLRLMLQSEVIVDMCISLGIAFILLHATIFKEKLHQYGIAVLIALIFPAFLFVQNAGSVNNSTNDFYTQYAIDTLHTLPQHSIILCYTDAPCFSFYYAINVLHIRPDIALVTETVDQYRDILLQHFPHLLTTSSKESASIIDNIIEQNYGKRNIYVAFPGIQELQETGLYMNPYYVEPYGYLFKVTTNPLDFTPAAFAKSTQLQKQINKILTPITFDNRDDSKRSTKVSFITQASFAAYIENMDGYPTYAITTTKLAETILNTNFAQLNSFIASIQGKQNYTVSIPSASDFVNTGLSYYTKANYAKAKGYFLSAHLLDPSNQQISGYLAQTYLKLHDMIDYKALLSEKY